jgi:hypothetical protein
MLHKAFIPQGQRMALVLALLAGCSGRPSTQQSSPGAPRQPVERAAGPKKPAEAIFGRPDENGRWLRLREVRFVSGKTFGWRIRLPCRQPIEYTEVMKLPAPGDFTFEPEELPETTISEDQRTATTHNYAACIDGWIEHSWALAENDPKGLWEISVAIAGYETQVWRVSFLE